MPGHQGRFGRRQAARLSKSCALVFGLLAAACSDGDGEGSGQADASSTVDGGSLIDGGSCDRSGLERTSEMAERVWASMRDTDSRECRNCHTRDAMSKELQSATAQARW